MRLSFIIFLFAVMHNSYASNFIRITGSTSVFPIMTRIAENFAKQNNIKTPIIEATGTGVGFSLFCKDIGDNFPDMVMASRKVKDKEIELCKSKNISFSEYILGYDAMVIIASKNSEWNNINSSDITTALVSRYKNWREISSNLPDNIIQIYGPSSNSGNYDSFKDLVMLPNCSKETCHINQKSGYVETNNQNVIISKVLRDPRAMGIITYAYYLEHRHELKLLSLDGVYPDSNNIKNKSYKITRDIALYYKDNSSNIDDIEKLIQYIKASKQEIERMGIFTLD